MLFRVNHSSGVPLYLQLMEQVKHAIETGALRAGEKLPTIRKVAADLVMNPNTAARAYRELEQAGIIEVRHGAGAFVGPSATRPPKLLQKAQSVAQACIEHLSAIGLAEDEMRRLFENELTLSRTGEAQEEKSE